MRKRTITRIALIIIMILIIAADINSENVQALSSQQSPLLWFDELKELSGYIKGERTVDEEPKVKEDFENYIALLKIKEEGKIPVPVLKSEEDKEGSNDYSLDISEIEVRSVSGGGFGELNYYCLEGEQKVNVTILFPEGDVFQGEDRMSEMLAVPEIEAELWRMEKKSDKLIQLYDRSVDALYYDATEYYKNWYQTFFIYDDLLVFIEGPADLLPKGFLGQFSLEYLELDYEVKNKAKFLRGYNEGWQNVNVQHVLFGRNDIQ